MLKVAVLGAQAWTNRQTDIQTYRHTEFLAPQVFFGGKTIEVRAYAPHFKNLRNESLCAILLKGPLFVPFIRTCLN